MVRLMLVLGLVFSLAACGGSRTDGLSQADEETLEAQLDAAETERAAAEAAQDRAEAAQAVAETARDRAEAAQDRAEMVQAVAETAQDRAETAQAAAETAQAVAEMAQDRAEMAQDRAEMAQDRAEAETVASKADLDTAKADLDTAKADLDTAKTDLDTAKTDLDTAKADLDTAKADLDTAKADLDTAQRLARREVGDALDARQELADARQELADARQELADARGEAATASDDAAAAERERARLAAEAAKAQQETLQADADDAFVGLNVPDDDNINLEITPKYRAPAGVGGAGTISETSGSSAGSWYVTTARSIDGNDIVRVYTDVRTPDLVNIETKYSAFTIPEGKNYREATINGITDYEDLFTSSSFPTAGRGKDITLTRDTNTDDTFTNDTARFSGYFAGASGYFYCVATDPGAAGACNVKHDGHIGYTLTGGDWTFQTNSKTAKVKVPDTNYMYFGWWRQKRTGEYFYKTFNDSLGDSAAVASVSGVSGTAHYVGPAIGQYAILQHYPGSPSNHGEFKATARLTANFGTTTMVYGSVTGFDVNPDWALTLEETAVTGGVVTAGGISWTIGGNNTHDNKTVEGTWAGKFHNELETFGDQHPEGISGTFDASYESVAKLRGAYGAHLQ